jgi:2-polyprenyl-3-methyl-5-hydroxy-6-metoxy-1,4-benzoquinol methylase
MTIAPAVRVHRHGDLPQLTEAIDRCLIRSGPQEPELVRLTENLEKYIKQNLEQAVSETDLFTRERYVQFDHFLPKDAKTILDVGANTGRGGQRLAELNPTYKLTALDCVQSRLNALPKCYGGAICGLSNAIPAEDQSFDAIVAGEFLEHLYPCDVDPTLCEFQRVLKVGGRLLMTTPNPAYVRLWLSAGTVYTISHLTQHWPAVLKTRLRMHGFSRVRIYGSGKVSRYLGYNFPIRVLYGSYLIMGDKY